MKIKYVLIFLLPLSTVFAQKVLTIEDAVKMALETNLDIRMAGNNAEIARKNNTPGNAGMLPQVSIIGSGNYESNRSDQKLSSGLEINNLTASTTSFNAGTELSWTLFDGGKMFVTKSKLRQIQTLGEIAFKEQVLQTQFEVFAAYYEVVRQKQQLNSYNEAINFNRERVKIAQAGFDAGSLMKSDLLQAKIDLNVAMENAINQQSVMAVGKRNLNQLLGIDPQTAFETTDEIPLDNAAQRSVSLEQLNASNATILSLQKQVQIAELALMENKKLNLPVLNFNAGYSLSQINKPNGEVTRNTSLGPQLGGVMSIPIYKAGENKRKIAVAKLQLQSAQSDLEKTKRNVNAELQNTLTEFENQQRLVQMEGENRNLAKEYLEISIQRLRLGQTNSLEVHQAQEDYIQSCTRFINFKFNLKMAETKLKQLLSAL